jgi:hypothetical protein
VTWTRPALMFRCGACGTQASGFQLPSQVLVFQAELAKVCKGFPPASPCRPREGEDTHPDREKA